VVLNTIRLSPQLHREHHRVLLRYLKDERDLSYTNWVVLAEIVDVLGVSVVVVDGQEQTFRRFYEERIDQRFADPFLTSLLASDDVERKGRRAQAAIAQEICHLLDGMEGFNRDDANCRLLLVYCLYWWGAFARGYIFEVAILRDLAASGIQFVAHDLTNRSERLTPYDLLLLDLRGDIKYTTYFLTVECLTRLVSDFFITRWYLTHRREWLRVAILRETAWQRFSLSQAAGERQTASLDDVASALPQAVVFAIGSILLTTLGYGQWKQQVVLMQLTKGV
jgi:hypothetical protein